MWSVLLIIQFLNSEECLEKGFFVVKKLNEIILFHSSHLQILIEIFLRLN